MSRRSAGMEDGLKALDKAQKLVRGGQNRKRASQMIFTTTGTPLPDTMGSGLGDKSPGDT